MMPQRLSFDSEDYLGMSIDFSKGHILAYHWRTQAEKECFMFLFSFTLKSIIRVPENALSKDLFSGSLSKRVF